MHDRRRCEGDLVCSTVVDLGGLFNDQFCSECGSDADCADGEQCAPNFDLGSFAGYRECVPAGSLTQDSLCDVNEQCDTGFCSEADIMASSSSAFVANALPMVTAPDRGPACPPPWTSWVAASRARPAADPNRPYGVTKGELRLPFLRVRKRY